MKIMLIFSLLHLFHPRSNPMKVKVHYIYERQDRTELTFFVPSRQRFQHWSWFTRGHNASVYDGTGKET